MHEVMDMTVKQRLTRSNVYMFLVPLLIAAMLLILGADIALYFLETKYLPRLGLSLYEMHMTLEQYETTFSSLEVFIWTYLGAVGMALLLTICFTNFFLTRSLFRHISAPLDELVAGVERIQGGNLDEPIAYDGNDEFKAACDAVDLMAAKLKAALDDEQRRQQSRKELIAGMLHDLKSPLTSIRAYSEAIRDGVAQKPEMQQRYIETICRKEQEIETMVNRLFEFSKLDLSELPLKMEAVDVGAELRAIAEDYSDKAYVNVSADECTAEADREQLRRIAKNIIDNITVAVHINRLREKVELDPSHPQMIQTVWGVGYRLVLRYIELNLLSYTGLVPVRGADLFYKEHENMKNHVMTMNYAKSFKRIVILFVILAVITAVGYRRAFSSR